MVTSPTSYEREISMLHIAVVQAGPATVRPEATTGRAATVARFLEAIQTGDYAVLQEVLTPDAITHWPQSGERITGAMACIRIYESYPGEQPKYRVVRITGAGDTWVAELVGDYADERWYTVSIFAFEGERIARITDYFGPTLQAPDWRRELVDPTT
jgi:limonene-1,2-epoxide hydrolase